MLRLLKSCACYPKTVWSSAFQNSWCAFKHGFLVKKGICDLWCYMQKTLKLVRVSCHGHASTYISMVFANAKCCVGCFMHDQSSTHDPTLKSDSISILWPLHQPLQGTSHRSTWLLNAEFVPEWGDTHYDGGEFKLELCGTSRKITFEVRGASSQENFEKNT